MNKGIQIAAALSLGLLMLAADGAAEDRPGWITHLPESEKYRFFLGVASHAETIEVGRQQAANHAMKELAQFLGVQIEASFEMLQTELQTRIKDELRAISEHVKIRGGLIHDWHAERSSQGTYTVYVLLRVPREEIEAEQNRLAQVRLEKALLAQQAMRQGRAAEAAGNALSAYDAYVRAIESAALAQEEVLRHEGMRRVASLLGRVRLELVAGDGQRVEVTRGPETPLVIRAFLELENRQPSMESQRRPVSRLPVRFVWATVEDLPACETRTDGAGLASCHPSRLPISRGRASILVTIDKARFPAIPLQLTFEDRRRIETMLEGLTARSVEFHMTSFVEEKGTRVVVLIEEKSLGRPLRESIVAHTVAAALMEAGYQVIAEHELGKDNRTRLVQAIDQEQFWSLGREVYKIADLVIYGSCETRGGAGVDGVDVQTARAKGFLKAVELETGRLRAMTHLQRVSGFGLTQEEAALDAHGRLSEALAQDMLDQLLAQGS